MDNTSELDTKIKIILDTLEVARSMPGHAKGNGVHEMGLLKAVSRWVLERYGIQSRVERVMLGTSYLQAGFSVMYIDGTGVSADGLVGGEKIFRQYIDQNGISLPKTHHTHEESVAVERGSPFEDNPHEKEYYSYLVKTGLNEIAGMASSNTCPPKPAM